VKPRSKFIFKKPFFFNLKLNGWKLGFNTPLKINNDSNKIAKSTEHATFHIPVRDKNALDQNLF